MNLAAGTVFNGLKLLELCGGGAYGDVWYCEDISGRKLALKVVSKKRLGNFWERELKGVANYMRITGGDANLLKILHISEDDETFYYTMEAADSADPDRYVPDTLAHRLQSGPLPPGQLYPVLRGIFDGIKTIHDAGFAHRDIKPDNIIFVEGVPKLGDIGLVSSLSNSMTGLAGTLEFLPPEVRSSDAPDSGDRSSRQRNDLYAFGKVVYCAATGLEPGNFPTVPTREKLSPGLKLLLQLSFKLCEKNPERRICDVETLDRELELIKTARRKNCERTFIRVPERVKRVLLTPIRNPIRINKKTENFFKWFHRHPIAVLLFLLYIYCYWTLTHFKSASTSNPVVKIIYAEATRAPSEATTTEPKKYYLPIGIPPEPKPEEAAPAKPQDPNPQELAPAKPQEPKPEEAAPAKPQDPKPQEAASPKTQEKNAEHPPAPPQRRSAGTRRSRRVTTGSKNGRTGGENSATKPQKTEDAKSMLEEMLDSPSYRELAEARIKELKETEALRQAGKYDVSDDPSRSLEEDLWQQLEKTWRYRNIYPAHSYIYRIERIRKDRKAFEDAYRTSGKSDAEKPRMSELAVHIGWGTYRKLLGSKDYGKLIADYEAEIAAAERRRKKGEPEPTPSSSLVLEQKLWNDLKKNQFPQRVPYILDHIKEVRSLRNKVKDSAAEGPKNSRKLVNRDLKFSMYIPEDWIVAQNRPKGMINSRDPDFSPDQLNETQKTLYERLLYLSNFKLGWLMIYCDQDKDWRDTICVQKYEVNGGALFRQSSRGNIVSGRYCLVEENPADAMNDPDVKYLDLNVARYFIDNGDSCIVFELEAKKSTFKKRRKELESALQTMNFSLSSGSAAAGGNSYPTSICRSGMLDRGILLSERKRETTARGIL